MDAFLVKESMDAFMTCSVCMQVMSSTISQQHFPLTCVPCGHRYCALCIYKWLGTNRLDCPMCRCNIDALLLDHAIDDIASLFLRHTPRSLRDNEDLSLEDESIPRIVLRKNAEADAFGFSYVDRPHGPGVRVLHIDQSRQAYAEGLRAGDVILSVNFKPISTAATLNDLINQSIQKDDECTLLICQRHVCQVTVVRNVFKTTPLGLLCQTDGLVLHKGDIVVSCNGKTDNEMTVEMLKLGSTIDGRSKMTLHKKSMELVYKQMKHKV